MARRILIIDGHPDGDARRYVHALTRAYEDGALAAGHEVRRIPVASLEFPLLRRNDDYRSAEAPAAIRDSQQAIAWAEHLVIVFPLWLGSMPALLKAFFEQTLRPGFAFAEGAPQRLPKRLLRGKSARIVVTMGMPALFYRWYFRAHSLKSLERNILGFCGVGPVHSLIVGTVETMSQIRREDWLVRMRSLGRRGR